MTPRHLELSRCSVFIDFDGTASVDDVGMLLLNRYAHPAWRTIDDRYESGAIGSRQWVEELWPLLNAVPMEALRACAASVPLDPGFAPLVSFLDEAGASVFVVSDGLGFYVAERCAGTPVTVLANGVSGGAPTFPWSDPSCPCGRCGTCKAEPVRRARSEGRTTVVVGDGTSDRYAAAAADVVFAKERLADWCAGTHIPFRPFVMLADVERELRRMAMGSGPARHPSRARLQ